MNAFDHSIQEFGLNRTPTEQYRGGNALERESFWRHTARQHRGRKLRRAGPPS